MLCFGASGAAENPRMSRGPLCCFLFAKSPTKGARGTNCGGGHVWQAGRGSQRLKGANDTGGRYDSRHSPGPSKRAFGPGTQRSRGVRRIKQEGK